jgi:DNA repair protein RadA
LDYEDSSQKFIPINSIESLTGYYDSIEVTPQVIDQLRDAGYRTLQRIVVSGEQKVSDDIRVSIEDAQRICCLAGTKIREFEIDSAPAFSDLSGRYSSMVHIRTGSKVLDRLLGGGMEVGAITELFGRSGSGKTQLCHTISVTSQTSPNLQYPLKKTKEGRSSKVIYIDTEGTFRPERIIQIARARGLREDKVVRNIHVIDCSTVFEQELSLSQIHDLLDEDKSISLVIADSIIRHFRSEYSGRSSLPER